MKKTFLSLLCLLICTAAFSGDPIPGVPPACDGTPGCGKHGIILTDNAGKFKIIADAGKFDLSIPYNDVQVIAKQTGKKWDVVTLTIEAGGNKQVFANGKALPGSFKIFPNSQVITIKVAGDGATINCTLIGSSSQKK